MVTSVEVRGGGEIVCVCVCVCVCVFTFRAESGRSLLKGDGTQ